MTSLSLAYTNVQTRTNTRIRIHKRTLLLSKMPIIKSTQSVHIALKAHYDALETNINTGISEITLNCAYILYKNKIKTQNNNTNDDKQQL